MPKRGFESLADEPPPNVIGRQAFIPSAPHRHGTESDRLVTFSAEKRELREHI